jgi:gluconokinase
MDPADPAAVDPDVARSPLVLALDIGTSSVRALAYDGSGRCVNGWEVHKPYRVTAMSRGGIVVDAEELLDHSLACIDGVVSAARNSGRSLDAAACDTFWHSLMGLDRQGAPLTPVLTWADTRSAGAARELKRRLDPSVVFARTGTELHASYWPAKLLWLSDTDPDTFQRVHSWVSFGEYLYLRLFGELQVSVSMASCTGLFNQRACAWDAETLAELPIEPNQLSPVAEDARSVTELGDVYRKRWPELDEVPWYLPIGDGAANNVGSGGTGPDRAVVMVGTSGALRVVRPGTEFDMPRGLWTYRVDRQRIVQGGALSAAGNVYAWALDTLAIPDRDAMISEVHAMKPDSHGLTILPFLAGERSPTWNPDADSAIEGLTLSSRPVEIVRALLEAMTYRFRLVYDIIVREIPSVCQVIGSGAGLVHSPEWTQLLADVLGKPVTVSGVAEASSRGAALLALEHLGAVNDIADVEAPMGKIFAPNEANVPAYRGGMQRQQDLYKRLLE